MSQKPTAPQPPLWRQVYDGIERQLSPAADSLVGSQAFGSVLGLGMRSRRAVSEQIGRVTGGVLHLLNLPAATDVSRILREIGALNKQIRILQVEIETGKDQSDGNNS